jgi:hypothetical protein
MGLTVRSRPFLKRSSVAHAGGSSLDSRSSISVSTRIRRAPAMTLVHFCRSTAQILTV